MAGYIYERKCFSRRDVLICSISVASISSSALLSACSPVHPWLIFVARSAFEAVIAKYSKELASKVIPKSPIVQHVISKLGEKAFWNIVDNRVPLWLTNISAQNPNKYSLLIRNESNESIVMPAVKLDVVNKNTGKSDANIMPYSDSLMHVTIDPRTTYRIGDFTVNNSISVGEKRVELGSVVQGVRLDQRKSTTTIFVA